MVARITYNKKHTYHTKSNLVKRFRTPGGVLKFKKLRKVQSPVVCEIQVSNSMVLKDSEPASGKMPLRE